MKKIFVITTLILLAAVFTPGVLPAMDVEGAYQYKELGYSGTMTISRQGPGFVFVFNTTSQSNGQSCDFTTYETPIDQGGGRIEDDRPAQGGTGDDGIKFKISFAGKTATVEVESKGEECGMSGYFGGTYVKIK